MAIATAQPRRRRSRDIDSSTDWLGLSSEVNEESPERPAAVGSAAGELSAWTEVALLGIVVAEATAKLGGTAPGTEEHFTVQPTRPARRDSSLEEGARFLAELYRISTKDEHTAADHIYSFVDWLLLDADFFTCDLVLKEVKTDRLSLSSTISFLIVTRRARAQGHLPSGVGFLDRAIHTLSAKKGSKEADRLLRKYQ